MKRKNPFLPLLLFAFLAIGCATTRPLVDAGVANHIQNPVLVAAPAMVASVVAGPMAGPPAPVALKLEESEAAPKTIRSQTGTASFYHSFFEGRTTANGQKFSNEAMTAASRTLDFGTRVRVTNLRNSKSVVVTINDRGPYVDGRIIDLSRRAATDLGFVNQGLTRVRIDRL
jgi:rare lipoprotein A